MYLDSIRELAFSDDFIGSDRGLLFETSDSETLGFVVLESMASGVPVIGCRAGGIPNLIEEGVNGYLVDIGDEKKWIEYVDELLFQNPEKRNQMGKGSLALYGSMKDHKF